MIVRPNKIMMTLLVASFFSFNAAANDLGLEATINSQNEIDQSKYYSLQKRQDNVNLAADRLSSVRAALHSFYMKFSAWPASLGELTTNNLYHSDFSTPYGNVQGVISTNGYDLSINIPDGGSKTVIVKMIASKVGGTVASDELSFNMTVVSPGAALLVDNLLSREADPNRPNNNQMLQDLNFNGFDAENIEVLDANIVNANSATIAGLLETESLTATLEADFEGGVNINTNNGANNLIVSRSGSDVSEALILGVTDNSVEQLYTNNNDYGVVNFNLASESNNAVLTPLSITKDGLISFNEVVWTAGNDGSGSGLDADTIDGFEATEFVRLSENNTFTGTNTFSSATVYNAGATYNAEATYNSNVTFNGVIDVNGGLRAGGRMIASSDGSSLYESGVALEDKYAGLTSSNTFAGVNTFSSATVYNAGATYNSNVTFNGVIDVNGGLRAGGRMVANSDGSSLYESGVALEDKYAGLTSSNTFTGVNSFNSTANFNGVLNANSTANFNGDLNANSTSNFNGVLNANSTSNFNGVLNANNGINIGSGKTLNHNSTSSYDKLRLWSHSSYAIGMASGQRYGFLNDYAMTFTMNNDSDRGFLWRDSDDSVSDGAMSLTTGGRLMLKDRLSFNNNQNTYLSGNGNAIRTQTSTGYVDIGSQNSSWMHFVTDRAGFYMNKKLHASGEVAVYGSGTKLTSSTIYENGAALSGKYLGINSKAKDADTLDGYDSTEFARRNVANTFTQDQKITKNNAWFTLDSSSSGGNGTNQAAGISIGESGYKGAAAIHMTYTGDGYGHLGMGAVSASTGLPAYEALRFHYQSNSTVALGRIYAKNGVHVQGDWLRVDGTNGLYFQSYGGGWHMQDSTWLRSYGGKSILTSGVVRADGGIQVDGKWIANSTGTVLFENNQALSTRYLGRLSKAYDSDRLDGLDSSYFARRNAPNTFTSTNTFSSTVNLNGGVRVDGKWVVSPDGNTLYENGVALKDKYALKSGGEVLTTLFYNSSGQDSGNILLLKSYRDFDEILIIGANDGGGEMNRHRLKISDYDRMRQFGRGEVAIYHAGSAGSSTGWFGYFLSNTYFVTREENSRIYAIYGVNY